jgi:hypothetical protein
VLCIRGARDKEATRLPTVRDKLQHAASAVCSVQSNRWVGVSVAFDGTEPSLILAIAMLYSSTSNLYAGYLLKFNYSLIHY